MNRDPSQTKPDSPAGAIFLLFGLFLLWVGSVRIAPPDLAFYYSYAHSFLYDLDFFYGNQFQHFPFAVHETYRTVEGYPANDWPVGCGAAWLPFLALARAGAWALSLAGVGPDAGGYGWFTQWVVTYGATLVFSAGTLYLSLRLCRREGSTRSAALWAVGLIAFGSTYTYHLLVNSADSHPPAAFFLVLFLLLWREYEDRPRPSHAFLAGCCLGVSALIRPHNAVFLLVPILRFRMVSQPSVPRKEILRGGAVLLLGAVLFYFPQLTVWKELYGSWLALPRGEEVLWTKPHLFEMLFSDFHGMVSWSPLFGLGLLGLFGRRQWIPYLVPVLLQIYVYSCNVAWWAGGSFGNRRMVGCVPLLILGLAGLLDIVPKMWMKILALLGAGWTLGLLFAEVGGAVRLDRYQPWLLLVQGLPAGAARGLIRFFGNPEWTEHGIERVLGAGLVLLVLGLLYTGALRYRDAVRRVLPAAVLALGLGFAVLHVAAMDRSRQALAGADVSGYSARDRFTWQIKYEEGFYRLQRNEWTKALRAFTTAAVAEDRYSQPWMYTAFAGNRLGWNRPAYHAAALALERGQAMPEFLLLFEQLLGERILQENSNLHIYYNRRGVVRTLLGNGAQADSDFRMSLQAKPDYATAQENRAILEKRMRGEAAPPLGWE